MKKRIIFLALFVLLLVGCTENEGEITYESAAENKYEAVIKRGSNYRIVETDEPFVLCYEILNNSGEVVRSGTGWRMPSFSNISEDVLEISIGAGTGTQMVQFYSAKNDILSEVFDTPIAITDELIGLLRRSDNDTINLIVRDIFDTEIYYNEFLLEDFSSVANPIDALIQVEYLGNGRVEVTYLSEQDFVEITTILVL